jgi:hypothetical protein
LILGKTLLNALASFSATGCTVVEPDSVIVPESSPGIVVAGLGVELGRLVVVAGAVVEGLPGFVVVVGVDFVHPTNAIARTITIASGRVSHFNFLIVYFILLK